MEDTAGLLTAELNDLFERIGLVLNKIETKLPPEECTKCVQGLPAPSLLVFSRLLLMMGKRLQNEPIHIPTDKSNAALNCHHESPAVVNNAREDLCPPGDRGEDPSPVNHNDTLSNEASHFDHGGTVDHRQSHRNSSNPDQRIDLYRPFSISTSLHNALIKHQGNPQSFFKSTHRIGVQVAGGLTGAFFRLHQKCDDIQDEKIRDIYLQMHLLYRRLEFRNLFLLAKELGYHTGDRWRRDACLQLAAQIKQKHPSLDADELLEEYVRLGRAYNKWAEELGGPGYLLILPLTVTEYQCVAFSSSQREIGC
ncbi:hypothetical protein PENSUB_4086 [Penicillium subrubescens]|uniref:Uncharacterized protein n=1 Tax=Penicillium subrubescens TaxID=1316194 RepID=A0A1Q5UDE9_9EURO|nr:hypothetical protein PENSUB_4086 [Penicillium subrubescens]